MTPSDMSTGGTPQTTQTKPSRTALRRVSWVVTAIERLAGQARMLRETDTSVAGAAFDHRLA
jgi:hypothetical protein